MEKKEFVAVVAISVIVVIACKKVQKITPGSATPEAETNLPALQAEALPVQKLAVENKNASASRSAVASVSASESPSASAPEKSVAALDLAIDTEQALPQLDISIHAPEAMMRHFKLYDLSMMLTSQVIIEPFVEKFTISAPVFYIDTRSAENSVVLPDAKGRGILFL